jgi:hypothetical protein
MICEHEVLCADLALFGGTKLLSVLMMGSKLELTAGTLKMAI